VGAATVRPGIDFMPLTVDYLEKTSAAGKIPGRYFKREGRLTETEVPSSRIIDRHWAPWQTSWCAPCSSTRICAPFCFAVPPGCFAT